MNFNPRDPAVAERLGAAIRAAEKDTSGEIRVHVQPRVKGDIMEAAKRRFEKLGMTRTQQRNGVLFFLATKDKRFAVLGDKGIDERVPDDFWDETVALMSDRFRAGDAVGALELGIRHAGKALGEFFPHQRDDTNELDDEISIDE